MDQGTHTAEMIPHVAPRIRGITGSPMMALVAKTGELKALGRDIIGLAAGEPDFATPLHIQEGAIAAMRAGQTRYTAVDGTSELKAAVITKFKRENGLAYTPDEVMVGTGGKQIIFNAFFATVGQGDEVLIPTPAYPAYSEIARLCGGKAIDLPCSQAVSFKLRPEQLDRAITPRTKWLVVNSPSNPTGAVYGRDELRALAQVLLRNPHVSILSDDIYEHLLFSGVAFSTIVNVAEELKDRTLIVNGVSKAYCMTGWRIGYGAGPRHLIKAMKTIQSQCTSNPCSISQAAALAALEGPQEFLTELNAVYRSRRDLVVHSLNQTPHLQCLSPEGAFYAFVSCAGAIGKKSLSGVIADDTDFTSFLLESAGVVVVPGDVFGAPSHFRLSYAAGEAELREACERISRACNSLA
jgi:aspartate aminotransferase